MQRWTSLCQQRDQNGWPKECTESSVGWVVAALRALRINCLFALDLKVVYTVIVLSPVRSILFIIPLCYDILTEFCFRYSVRSCLFDARLFYFYLIFFLTGFRIGFYLWYLSLWPVLFFFSVMGTKLTTAGSREREKIWLMGSFVSRS